MMLKAALKTAFLGILIVLAAGCSSTPTIEKKITGRWELAKVLQNDSDVTKDHDPKDNRYIIFTDDGRFESGGNPVGKNTGTWSILPESQELFLDSDAGEDDDSYWTVTFPGNQMHWKGTRGFGTAFKLQYTR